MTTPTQPPDHCPVCLETLVDRASAAFITFVCGQVMYLDEGGEWNLQTSWECVCERSQQFAIALRADLAQARATAESVPYLRLEVERLKGEAEYTKTLLQEIDTLKALPTPALDAARAQMERDCQAVCKLCATGRGKLDNSKAEWFHIIKLDGWDKPEYVPCNAAAIRSAFALSAAGMEG